MTDVFPSKIEEWIQASKGRIRADKAHRKLLGLGHAGSEQSTGPAVAPVKAAWRLGNIRAYRPRIAEPRLRLQCDFGTGPDEQVVIVHRGAWGPVEVARYGRVRRGSPAVDDDHFPAARTKIPGDWRPRHATRTRPRGRPSVKVTGPGCWQRP